MSGHCEVCGVDVSNWISHAKTQVHLLKLEIEALKK